MAERAYVAVSGDMLDRLQEILDSFDGATGLAFRTLHAAVQQWHDEVEQAAADA